MKLRIEKEKKETFEKIYSENSSKTLLEDDTKEKKDCNMSLKSNKDASKIEDKIKPTQIESSKVVEIKPLPPEQYYGNLEYKLKLIHTSNDRLEGLTTQMKFRLQEGHGECYYMIGVEDNGNPIGLSETELKESLETLKIISDKLGAKFCILNEHQGKIGKFAEVIITFENSNLDKMEIKIGLIGEESSGKSSIV